MTEVRSKARKPCQFPFVLLNQTFNECTNILSVNQETGKITTIDEPWCSTKVDPKTKKHIEGYYGDCPSTCQAQDPRTGMYMLTLEYLIITQYGISAQGRIFSQN